MITIRRGASWFQVLTGVGLSLLLQEAAARGAVTKIAVIGESTTASGHQAPEFEWPARLATMLGSGYSVLSATNKDSNTLIMAPPMIEPGTAADKYPVNAPSIAGPPDIVVIGPFGGHDFIFGATPLPTAAAFQKVYVGVVDYYLALKPPRKVYVMTRRVCPRQPRVRAVARVRVARWIPHASVDLTLPLADGHPDCDRGLGEI